MAARHRILYDADCGFCRWSLAWILRWDRHHLLDPVPLQEPAADELLPGLDEPARMASWHLVSPGGEVASGGRAAIPLLRLLPGGGPLAPIAARFPGLLESGYRLVADNRSRISRLITSGAKARADRVIATHAVYHRGSSRPEDRHRIDEEARP